MGEPTSGPEKKDIARELKRADLKARAHAMLDGLEARDAARAEEPGAQKAEAGHEPTDVGAIQEARIEDARETGTRGYLTEVKTSKPASEPSPSGVDFAAEHEYDSVQDLKKFMKGNSSAQDKAEVFVGSKAKNKGKLFNKLLNRIGNPKNREVLVEIAKLTPGSTYKNEVVKKLGEMATSPSSLIKTSAKRAALFSSLAMSFFSGPLVGSPIVFNCLSASAPPLLVRAPVPEIFGPTPLPLGTCDITNPPTQKYSLLKQLRPLPFQIPNNLMKLPKKLFPKILRHFFAVEFDIIRS